LNNISHSGMIESFIKINGEKTKQIQLINTKMENSKNPSEIGKEVQTNALIIK
jgi:hypothetical protein